MLPSRERRRGRQRGAALLLLVAVLGIGASAALIGIYNRPHGEQRQQALTAAALVQAREALLGYVVRYRRLPRPATTLDGTESQQACNDDSSCTGLLPWRTLGLPPGDGWNKLLRYSASPDFVNGRPSPEATKTVIDRDGDGEPFYRVGTANCVVDDRCAAAVVFSSGRYLGVSLDGVTQANPVSDNEDEQLNDQAARDFLARADSSDPTSPGGSFSNMVRWLPLPLIRDRLKAANKSSTR